MPTVPMPGNISNLGVGPHTIIAQYSGDTYFATTTNTTPLLVVAEDTQTTLSAAVGVNPAATGSAFGQSVMFTAKVIDKNAVTGHTLNQGPPTGTVSFYDNDFSQQRYFQPD